MASDQSISQFTEICGCSTRIAKQYLQLADDNIEQATMLFFENGGVDMNPTESTATAPAPASASRADTSATRTERAGRGATGRRGAYREDSSGVVDLASDEDEDADDVFEAADNPHYESDEAMARRLQEEMYGAGGSGAGAGDADDVRAPIARTTETLVGPDFGGMGMGMGMGGMGMGLGLGRGRRGPLGVFNQSQTSSSIWNTEDNNEHAFTSTASPSSSSSSAPAAARNARTAPSTTAGGNAQATAKQNRLAEMYRPPFDLMTSLSWDGLREEARSIPKWIMINIQDPSIFDCQVLNRDLFRDESIKETIKQSFLFAQYTVDDPRAQTYLNYYFQNYESEDAFPYIAIVDPRTGEQVKKWSGRPVPERSEFLIQIHEFLDRYSLSVWAKNPVAVQKKGGDDKKKTTRDLERMTEEEQLEMAMRESLGEKVRERSVDPDELTRDKGKQKADGEQEQEQQHDEDKDVEMIDDIVPEPEVEAPEHGLFLAIPTPSSPIPEPPLGPSVTRIQFRHPNGRVIRRFSLQDPVRRVYEWMKVEPLTEEMKGKEFECVCLGKNLIWSLDETVEAAGLRNGTVMVGWVGEDEEEE